MGNIAIDNRDYWIKVVGMLQQNWALISSAASNVRVYFLNDVGGIFDELDFDSTDDAVRALTRNGFSRFSENREIQKFIAPPREPFSLGSHPAGKIYSSGKYWE